VPSRKIDDDHSLTRYVPFGKLRKHEDGESAIGVLSIAFELRPDEEYLSATWVEYFPDEIGAAVQLISAVRAIRKSKLKP
jgi:hypothetical protein